MARHKYIYANEERWEMIEEARKLFPDKSDSALFFEALAEKIQRKKKQQSDSSDDSIESVFS